MRLKVPNQANGRIRKLDDRQRPLTAALFSGVPTISIIAPENVDATVTGTETMDVTWDWTGNEADITGFSIERQVNGAGPWTEIATPGAAARTYGDSGLTPDTIYGYRIRAYVAGTPNQYSAYSNIGADATGELAIPTAVSATTVDYRIVTIAWADPSPYETSFEVQYKRTAGSAWVTECTVPPNTTTCDIGVLLPATSYDFRVRAVYGTYQSNYSAVDSATTNAEPAVPNANWELATSVTVAVNRIATDFDGSVIQIGSNVVNDQFRRSLNNANSFGTATTIPSTKTNTNLSIADNGLDCVFGTFQDEVVVSDDGGDTWAVSYTFPSGIYAVPAISPDASLIFAVTGSVSGAGNSIRSTDQGATWVAPSVAFPDTLSNSIPPTITNLGNDVAMVNGARTRVLVSTNGGNNFVIRATWDLIISLRYAADGSYLFVAARSGGSGTTTLRRSADDGANWTEVYIPDGFNNLSLLGVSADGQKVALAASDYPGGAAVLWSDDAGDTFYPVPAQIFGSNMPSEVAFSRNGNKAFMVFNVVGNRRVYRSPTSLS